MIFSCAETTRSPSTFKTCILYSIRRNSIKLPSAFIVCKYYFFNFYLISFNSLIACIYMLTIYFIYILLCRKKVMECMKGDPFDIWFVDPNRVHEQVVRDKPGQTEDFLLRSLLRQQTKREIILPYNLSRVLLPSLEHILFRLTRC